MNACSRNRCKDKSVRPNLFRTIAFHAGAPMAQKKERKAKRLESRCLSATEVTASCSGLLSHHCRWCSVLPALLPAWAGSRVTTCQAAHAYAWASLQTTCLVGASHPHGKQDMRRSTALHQSSPYAGHREA